MLREPRRLLSAGLAIVLGIAFVTATLLLGDTLNAAVRRQAAESVGDASVVVSAVSGPNTGFLRPDAVDTIRRLPGVTGVDADVRTHVWQPSSSPQPMMAMSVPAARSVEGRLPRGADEVAVNRTLVASQRVKIGDAIELATDPGQRGRSVRIVGVLVPRDADVPDDAAAVFGEPAAVMAWAGIDGYTELRVRGGDPVATQRAVAALPGVRDARAIVRTGPEEVAARVKQLTQGTAALTGLLLGFGVIALVVAALVIANTFAVLVAQRTRQLALLRCVGATRGQLVGLLLRESLGLGIVGSLAGLAAGFGLAAAGARLLGSASRIPLGSVAVTASSLLVPAAVGVVVTVLAGLVPARRATRVAPLAALRPQDAVAPTRTAGRVRLVAGLVATTAGVALLAWTVAAHSLPIGLAGGAVSFVGVLVVAPWLVPATARLVGTPVSRWSPVTGRLAVDNVRRNPGRAAATAGALLIGVTLITTMVVGAATGQRSVDAALDREFPTDAQVVGPMTPQLVDAVRGAPSVTHTSRVDAVSTRLQTGSTTREVSVLAVDPRAVDGLRDRGLWTGLADGTVLSSPGRGMVDGEMVVVGEGAHTLRLRALVRPDGPKAVVMTAADLVRLAPAPETVTGMLWVTFAPGADPAVTMASLNDRVAPLGGQADGAAAERAQLQQMVDLVLWVVVALLAVAVLIALVGVGNTLGLAVLERTRESGLLRALGLTRGQLRASFGLEAIVLAAVAAVLGLGLGIAYGIAGAYALLGNDLTVQVAVPWARLALVAAVCLAAGWLASVVPAAHGSRVSPTVALATE